MPDPRYGVPRVPRSARLPATLARHHALHAYPLRAVRRPTDGRQRTRRRALPHLPAYRPCQDGLHAQLLTLPVPRSARQATPKRLATRRGRGQEVEPKEASGDPQGGPVGRTRRAV